MGIETAIAAALVSAGASAAAAAAVASFVVSTAVSVVLSVAASALMGNRPRAEDLARELAQPDTAPSYRFVYGEARATGTPVGTPVRGDYIWGCWLLNSRESDLPTAKLFLDKRAFDHSGDPFDFTGTPGPDGTGGNFGGARATEFTRFAELGDLVQFWISRGDQTSPPRRFLEEAAWSEGGDFELWKASDAWRGRTVIWMCLDAGPSKNMREMWPAAPPLVEVEGCWSKVWDPRDAGQDADDPATWAWSDNHALACLDALRRNPVRGYTATTLHLASWIDAADAADEPVTLASGGTEPRYKAAGTLVWGDGEIEDQITPLVLSGAADLIRIGGQLGCKPGTWQAPQVSLDYLMGDGVTAPDLAPGAGLVNELRVSYLNPERGYETADLAPWPIPGALAEDGGLAAPKSLELSFCPSATQAMRVRKITGLRLRRQEKIEGGELPPEAFDLVAGATLDLTLPAPYDVLGGTYEVESLHPAADPLGSGGLALRMPAALVRTGPEIYAWSPEDEEEVIAEPYDGDRKSVRPPGPLTALTGDAVNLHTGKTTIPRIRFDFAPAPSGGVTGYEWEYRPAEDDWREGGLIGGNVRDAAGKVFAFTRSLATGEAYDIRVRAVGEGGRSEWVEITGVSPVVDIDLDLPLFDRAEEIEPGKVRVWFELPNDADVTGIEIFAGPTTDPADAVSLRGVVYAAPSATIRATESGLGSGVTRHYFARSRGDYASASGFTAAQSFTTA